MNDKCVVNDNWIYKLVILLIFVFFLILSLFIYYKILEYIKNYKSLNNIKHNEL